MRHVIFVSQDGQRSVYLELKLAPVTVMGGRVSYIRRTTCSIHHLILQKKKYCCNITQATHDKLKWNKNLDNKVKKATIALNKSKDKSIIHA